MLDLIRQLIAQTLELSTSEVNAVREELLAEQASADARYAATSALIHPEGSTTPINEAFSRAQDRAADLREKLEKTAPKVMALLLAFEIAVQRRDEADKHMRLKWNTESDGSGLRTEVRDWWRRLSRHGVHPHYLKQHAEPTIAIIADLVAWKAKDPTYKDPDNPWRALLRIYANRLIEKPSKHGKSNRSVTGTPERNPHPGGDTHYMFNEMVSPLWDMPPVADALVPVIAPAPRPTIDCSIYPVTDDAAAEPPEDLMLGMSLVTAYEEYPLPAHVSPEDADKLRLASEKWAHWTSAGSELQWVLDTLKGKSDAEVIKAIATTHRGQLDTPARYFVDAALGGGIEAGRLAHKVAAIRRGMIVVMGDEWKLLRAEMGLTW